MQYPWAIESPAPGIIDRQSVTEALQTGLIAIDSSIPIGCGQSTPLLVKAHQAFYKSFYPLYKYLMIYLDMHVLIEKYTSYWEDLLEEKLISYWNISRRCFRLYKYKCHLYYWWSNSFICRLISIRYSSSYRCWIICNTCGFYSSMVWNEICGRFL